MGGNDARNEQSLAAIRVVNAIDRWRDPAISPRSRGNRGQSADGAKRILFCINSRIRMRQIWDNIGPAAVVGNGSRNGQPLAAIRENNEIAIDIASLAEISPEYRGNPPMPRMVVFRDLIAAKDSPNLGYFGLFDFTMFYTRPF